MLLDERLVSLGLIGGADGGDNVSGVASVNCEQRRVQYGVVIVVLQVYGGAAVQQ